MYLIVGLGNPGKKYKETRHNVGSRAVDEIAANFQFPIFNAEISKGKIANQEVVLAKPQTFMNLSGKAIEGLIKNCKLKIKNLIVIHDDLDIPLGKIRISKGRGAAGHKGVQSIIDELGTKDFIRFRIGICPKINKPKKPENFVLQKFNKEEEKLVREVIKKTTEAIEFFLREGLTRVMAKFNF